MRVFASALLAVLATGSGLPGHGNLAVTLGGETEVLHRHGSAKDLDADAVMSLRKLLASHGIEPA